MEAISYKDREAMLINIIRWAERVKKEAEMWSRQYELFLEKEQTIGIQSDIYIVKMENKKIRIDWIDGEKGFILLLVCLFLLLYIILMVNLLMLLLQISYLKLFVHLYLVLMNNLGLNLLLCFYLIQHLVLECLHMIN